MSGIELLSSKKDVLDVVTFALALFGAWGSLIVVRDRRRWRLSVKARVKPPFEVIHLKVFNPGHRRLTIERAELRYGTGANFADEVLEVPSFRKVVLDNSDAEQAQVLVSDLRKAVAERDIGQKSYSRLYFVVSAFNDRTYEAMVEIDPSIIEEPAIPQAKIYIAADLLLGFPQMVSGVQPHWKIK